MPKFLTSNALNSEVEKIFEKAEQYLVIISPYIKLHPRFIAALKSKLSDHKFELTIVFGKNQHDKTRSIGSEDFDFFKQFPNVKIHFEPNLHAKYYANETSAILTSMNLYSFSQDNNIEAGVLTERTLLNNLANNLMLNVTGGESFDDQCFDFFDKVIDQADVVFEKTPDYEKALLGLTRKYKGSSIKLDKLSDVFQNKIVKIPVVVPSTDANPGYCIRTGKPIPFNPSKPLSDEAFTEWNKYKKNDYEENFCHFSGEASNGQTSYAKPILRKNWSRAKSKIKSSTH